MHIPITINTMKIKRKNNEDKKKTNVQIQKEQNFTDKNTKCVKRCLIEHVLHMDKKSLDHLNRKIREKIRNSS